MLETIVGFVALGISVFAVIISIVFYFKSDNLYKEMLKFISEIRVFSERTYLDTFGMVKEAWPHVWQKEEREKIIQETKEEKEKIKQEITENIMAEINKVKEINGKGVQTEQFKNEIANLEIKFNKAINEAFQKIEALDRKKERMRPSNEDIDRVIIQHLLKEEIVAFRVDYLLNVVTDLLEVSKSSVYDRILALKEKNLFHFKRDKLRHDTEVEVNPDKLEEMRFQKAGGKIEHFSG